MYPGQLGLLLGYPFQWDSYTPRTVTGGTMPTTTGNVTSTTFLKELIQPVTHKLKPKS